MKVTLNNTTFATQGIRAKDGSLIRFKPGEHDSDPKVLQGLYSEKNPDFLLYLKKGFFVVSGYEFKKPNQKDDKKNNKGPVQVSQKQEANNKNNA